MHFQVISLLILTNETAAAQSDDMRLTARHLELLCTTQSNKKETITKTKQTKKRKKLLRHHSLTGHKCLWASGRCETAVAVPTCR